MLPMRNSAEYVSTRDPEGAVLNYADVLLQGLAPDGGLYVPTEIPRFDTAELRVLGSFGYHGLYDAIKRRFVGDAIPSWKQSNIADDAYSVDAFPDALAGNVTPVVEISDRMFVQQLSLGPTAAFKDMAMQPLAREMDVVLGHRQEHLTLLGATSGDTGSAAEAAMRGRSALTLFMLSPTQGMSRFQKAQMGQLTGKNIYNISVDGRFDDCQDLVKAIKSDPEFADLGAVNSINWGRISAQIPYYFSGYFQVARQYPGEEVDFVVPTGNFGNILAGYLAKRMGLPIGRLFVATNENSVMHTLIQTGEYRSRPAQVTSSPSMDISKASNFERVLYYLMDEDPERTKAFMDEFEQAGEAVFRQHRLSSLALADAGFRSDYSTHVDRLDSMRWVYQQSEEIIDPHTADAVMVARMHSGSNPIVCMSTALPVKFEDTMFEALGFVPPRPERFEGLEERVQGGFDEIETSLDALKDYIRQHRLT